MGKPCFVVDGFRCWINRRAAGRYALVHFSVDAVPPEDHESFA